MILWELFESGLENDLFYNIFLEMASTESTNTTHRMGLCKLKVGLWLSTSSWGIGHDWTRTSFPCLAFVGEGWWVLMPRSSLDILSLRLLFVPSGITFIYRRLHNTKYINNFTNVRSSSPLLSIILFWVRYKLGVSNQLKPMTVLRGFALASRRIIVGYSLRL